MNLSICVITGRVEPQLDWLADSLRAQLAPGERPQLIVIDFWSQEMPQDNWHSGDVVQRRERITAAVGDGFELVITPPKPTVWQGPHRLTKENWFANSNARNTGFCLAKHPFVAFCDDRLVLGDHWLESVRLAMKGQYAVAGAYEKRVGMVVHKGRMTGVGTVIGRDNRRSGIEKTVHCHGPWFYGGTFALPLAWALAVNGFEEGMDSLSFEDAIFGMMLENNGYTMKYDPRMLIIEDRSHGCLGKAFRREDKGVIGTAGDKSHESLRRFGTKKRTEFTLDLIEIRNHTLKGEVFPVTLGQPSHDWFDGMKTTDFDKL